MAHRINLVELERNEGCDAVEIMEDVTEGVRHCPAMCSEGCEVEPDGTCPHGFPSLALHLGVV